MVAMKALHGNFSLPGGALWCQLGQPDRGSHALSDFLRFIGLNDCLAATNDCLARTNLTFYRATQSLQNPQDLAMTSLLPLDSNVTGCIRPSQPRGDMA